MRERTQHSAVLTLLLQNVTQCKLKSPGYVSRPHFHLADPYYVNQFQHGVRPDPDKHDSVFWVEPLTSIPFKARGYQWRSEPL